MVFLQLRELQRQWIVFPDLPTLLDGLAALPEPTCDAMGFWNGKYFLCAEKDAAALLSEFGQDTFAPRTVCSPGKWCVDFGKRGAGPPVDLFAALTDMVYY